MRLKFHPEVLSREKNLIVEYQTLFTEVLDPAWVDSLRACTNGGFVLGSDRFQRQIATLLGRRTWKGSPGRPEKQVADST